MHPNHCKNVHSPLSQQQHINDDIVDKKDMVSRRVGEWWFCARHGRIMMIVMVGAGAVSSLHGSTERRTNVDRWIIHYRHVVHCLFCFAIGRCTIRNDTPTIHCLLPSKLDCKISIVQKKTTSPNNQEPKVPFFRRREFFLSSFLSFFRNSRPESNDCRGERKMVWPYPHDATCPSRFGAERK